MITKEQADHIKELADAMGLAGADEAMAAMELFHGLGPTQRDVAAYEATTRAAARKLIEALDAVTEKP